MQACRCRHGCNNNAGCCQCSLLFSPPAMVATMPLSRLTLLTQCWSVTSSLLPEGSRAR